MGENQLKYGDIETDPDHLNADWIKRRRDGGRTRNNIEELVIGDVMQAVREETGGFDAVEVDKRVKEEMAIYDKLYEGTPGYRNINLKK